MLTMNARGRRSMRRSGPACSNAYSAGGRRTPPWTIRLPHRVCFRLWAPAARVPTDVPRRKSREHQALPLSGRRLATPRHHPRRSPWPCPSARRCRLLLLQPRRRNRHVPNRRYHPPYRPFLPCPPPPRRPIRSPNPRLLLRRRFRMFLPCRLPAFRLLRCRMSPPFRRSRFLCLLAAACHKGCRRAVLLRPVPST